MQRIESMNTGRSDRFEIDFQMTVQIVSEIASGIKVSNCIRDSCPLSTLKMKSITNDLVSSFEFQFNGASKCF